MLSRRLVLLFSVIAFILVVNLYTQRSVGAQASEKRSPPPPPTCPPSAPPLAPLVCQCPPQPPPCAEPPITVCPPGPVCPDPTPCPVASPVLPVASPVAAPPPLGKPDSNTVLCTHQFYDDSKENMTRLKDFGFLVVASQLFPERLAGMLATWLAHIPTDLRENVYFFVDNKASLTEKVSRLFNQAHSLRGRFSTASGWNWYERRIVEYDDKRGHNLSERVPHAFKYGFANFTTSVKWFMKLDDDTFVQLFRLLKMPIWDKFNPETEFGYIGYRRLLPSVSWSYNYKDGPFTFCDGGPGYFLSRKLLSVMIETNIWEPCKEKLPMQAPEDMATAVCIDLLLNPPQVAPSFDPLVEAAPGTPPMVGPTVPKETPPIAPPVAVPVAPPVAPPLTVREHCTHHDSFRRGEGLLFIRNGLAKLATTLHDQRTLDEILVAYDRLYLDLYLE